MNITPVKPQTVSFGAKILVSEPENVQSFFDSRPSEEKVTTLPVDNFIEKFDLLLERLKTEFVQKKGQYPPEDTLTLEFDTPTRGEVDVDLAYESSNLTERAPFFKLTELLSGKHSTIDLKKKAIKIVTSLRRVIDNNKSIKSNIDGLENALISIETNYLNKLPKGKNPSDYPSASISGYQNVVEYFKMLDSRDELKNARPVREFVILFRNFVKELNKELVNGELFKAGDEILIEFLPMGCTDGNIKLTLKSGNETKNIPTFTTIDSFRQIEFNMLTKIKNQFKLFKYQQKTESLPEIIAKMLKKAGEE